MHFSEELNGAMNQAQTQDIAGTSISADPKSLLT